jgi:hypothetical protein
MLSFSRLTQLWMGCILRAATLPGFELSVWPHLLATFRDRNTIFSRIAAFMAQRKLLQYGWITGPVECRCSDCDWTLTFQAVDATVPSNILADFEHHNCEEQPAAQSVEQGRPLRGDARVVR